MANLNFRSIWISDTHLGGQNLKSKQLYDFLKHTESQYLYLVGDIFDLWQLKKRWHWPEINEKIIEIVLEKARNGTQVYYLPGNHDAVLKKYVGATFSGVTICDEKIHLAADGSKYLVLHGDKFDCVVQNSQWLANFGSWLYDSLLAVNRWFNRYREFRGKNYFSISAWLKHKCKKAVNYVGDFENVVIADIKKNKVNGLICGHIHHASARCIENFLYLNAGDWVESCTAVAENTNGRLGVIQWIEQKPGFESLMDRRYEKNRYRDRCLAPTN